MTISLKWKVFEKSPWPEFSWLHRNTKHLIMMSCIKLSDDTFQQLLRSHSLRFHTCFVRSIESRAQWMAQWGDEFEGFDTIANATTWNGMANQLTANYWCLTLIRIAFVRSKPSSEKFYYSSSTCRRINGKYVYIGLHSAIGRPLGIGQMTTECQSH